MMRRGIVACMLLLSFMSLSAQEALPLYDLPDPVNFPAFSSNSLVALPGSRVATTNLLTNTITLVDVRQNQIIVEIPVGDDPRSIDVTPDRTRLLVTNRGDDSLMIIDIETQAVVAEYNVGSRPYGVITDNNKTAFVSLQGDDTVVEIDLATGDILLEIPMPLDPTGLAIWGDFLYVTHIYSGEISLIYLPVGDVVHTISTGRNAGLTPFILVDPINGFAYVPQSVGYPDSQNPTVDRTIRPRVVVIDLRQMRMVRDRTLWLDIADRPVNMPLSVALNTAQARLFALNAGSNNLSVIDLTTGLALWNTPLPDNPRGLAFASDFSGLYVNNAVDTSLSILETRFYSVTDTIPTTTNPPDLAMRIGADLFHSATDERVSGTPYLSCASCHFDGEADGRIWYGVITPSLNSVSAGFPLDNHIADLTFGQGFADSPTFDAEALILYMQSLLDN